MAITLIDIQNQVAKVVAARQANAVAEDDLTVTANLKKTEVATREGTPPDYQSVFDSLVTLEQDEVAGTGVIAQAKSIIQSI